MCYFFIGNECFKHLEVKALKLLHSARSRSPGAFDVVLCSATLDAAGSLAPKSDGGKAVERQMVPSKFRIAMAILKIQWVFNSEAGCAVGAQFFVSPLRDFF